MRVALKMIHGYGGPWKEVISLERVDGGRDSSSYSTWRGPAPLLSKLKGHAHGAMSQFGSHRVEMPGLF